METHLRKSRFILILLLASVLPTAVTRAESYHNALDPAARGGIVGAVEPAQGLQTVVAVEPFEMKAYQGRVDAATGRFEFHGLPPGEYDLLIKTVGHVYEGLSLEAGDEEPRADLATLRAQIAPMFFESEDYFNLKKIVRLTGSAERARMFVIQTRTKAVVNPAGNAVHADIRRFDLVELVKTHKSWQIANSRHLLRQEVGRPSADATLDARYSPRLGGILVGAAVKDLGTLKLQALPAAPADKYASADYAAK